MHLPSKLVSYGLQAADQLAIDNVRTAKTERLCADHAIRHCNAKSANNIRCRCVIGGYSAQATDKMAVVEPIG
jgi:hypothetical protein